MERTKDHLVYAVFHARVPGFPEPYEFSVPVSMEENNKLMLDPELKNEDEATRMFKCRIWCEFVRSHKDRKSVV